MVNETEHLWSPDKASHSLCPSSEYMRSSGVNKLGRYPSAKSTYMLGSVDLNNPFDTNFFTTENITFGDCLQYFHLKMMLFAMNGGFRNWLVSKIAISETISS